MNTVWILIILYSGTNTRFIEFNNKENCFKAMNEIQMHKDSWSYTREVYCVEK